MSDLISRQMAIDELWKSEVAFRPSQIDEVMRILYKAPAIDAAFMVHGEWVDPAAENCYRCSVCEEYTTMELPRLLYHYCPNCGAKMDEERKDEGE